MEISITVLASLPPSRTGWSILDWDIRGHNPLEFPFVPSENRIASALMLNQCFENAFKHGGLNCLDFGNPLVRCVSLVACSSCMFNLAGPDVESSPRPLRP